MEGEGQCDRGTAWDDRRAGRGESGVGPRETSTPKLRPAQAGALQNQGLIVPYRVTLVMIPNDKYITDREGPSIWILDRQRHRIIPR